MWCLLCLWLLSGTFTGIRNNVCWINAGSSGPAWIQGSCCGQCWFHFVCVYVYIDIFRGFILHFVLNFPFTLVKEHLCQQQHLHINLFWDFFVGGTCFS